MSSAHFEQKTIVYEQCTFRTENDHPRILMKWRVSERIQNQIGSLQFQRLFSPMFICKNLRL